MNNKKRMGIKKQTHMDSIRRCYTFMFDDACCTVLSRNKCREHFTPAGSKMDMGVLPDER